MSQISVDRAIESLTRREQKREDAAGREDGRHPVESTLIVLDMLEHIQADAAVRAEPGEIGKFVAGDIARETVHIPLIPVALSKALDATRTFVERNDSLAVEQHFREIADAAADFDHSAAQLRQDEAALPGEIVLRPGHTLLIFERVCKAGLRD
jgi:hypothetical protein